MERRKTAHYAQQIHPTFMDKMFIMCSIFFSNDRMLDSSISLKGRRGGFKVRPYPNRHPAAFPSRCLSCIHQAELTGGKKTTTCTVYSRHQSLTTRPSQSPQVQKYDRCIGQSTTAGMCLKGRRGYVGGDWTMTRMATSRAAAHIKFDNVVAAYLSPWH
jgi:hypothetical protein